MHDRPTFGSLFAGIGGIDLGLERAGWTGRWQAEYDPFCTRVLEAHWPDVTRYGDVTAVDWSSVERVDLIAGGFPCQPVSLAGKRLGQADERWLWPEFARAVRDVAPQLVLVENVPGLLARGMGDVLGGLADLGYDAEWEIVSAADVGAPHLRKRVWIVARRRAPVPHADRVADGRLDAGRQDREGPSQLAGPGEDVADAEELALWPGLRSIDPRRLGRRRPRDGGREGASTDVADPGRGDGRPWRSGRSEHGDQGLRQPVGPHPDPDADRLDVEPRGSRTGPHASSGGPVPADPDAVGERLEGLEQGGPEARSADGSGDGRDPGWWSVEPDVGRVAHGVPARVDRLRALGNAVVPQVAEALGRYMIERMDLR